MSTISISKPGLLLVLGAVLGAGLAATGVLEAPQAELGGELLASVNEEYISKSDYLDYLDLLTRDKRNPMSSADRRHVLDRIIEEKLLIERGLGIGLPYSDPKVRKAIVNAMIQTVISDVSNAEPETDELQAFYQKNSNYFARPARVHVQRMVFRGADARQRALAAHASLSEQGWQQVAQAMADKDILSLPASMLPVSKLAGYLGPTLTELALNLQPGGYSTPQAEQAGYSILLLVDLQRSEKQPLADVREQVLHEYQRRAGDNALREYLDELREAADIGIDETFLERMDQHEAAGA